MQNAGVSHHVFPNLYRGRRAVSVENERLRVTVLTGGRHIAEVHEKSSGGSPLWVPPWNSIEPAEFDRLRPAKYGDGDDNKLLRRHARGHASRCKTNDPRNRKVRAGPR